jgi:hypothetical protein
LLIPQCRIAHSRRRERDFQILSSCASPTTGNQIEKETIVKKLILCLLLIAPTFGCAEKPPAQTGQSKPAKDPKIAALEQNIAKVTPEAQQIIDQLKATKPEVNEQVATRTLAEIVDDYAKNKGDYNISPIGWEASQKKNNNWKLLFHYQDYQKQVSTAEWEFNPTTKKLYPFEFKNAPGLSVYTGVSDTKAAQDTKAPKTSRAGN